MKLEVNDKVRWYSVGLRGNLTRSGYVIAVVPKNTHALSLITPEQMCNRNISFTKDDKVRTTESYVVLVKDGNMKETLFWPRAHLLEKVLNITRGPRKRKQ